MNIGYNWSIKDLNTGNTMSWVWSKNGLITELAKLYEMSIEEAEEIVNGGLYTKGASEHAFVEVKT